MSLYTTTIQAKLIDMGRGGDIKPAHVESLIRDKYRVLDGLSRAELRREVASAVRDLDADPELVSLLNEARV